MAKGAAPEERRSAIGRRLASAIQRAGLSQSAIARELGVAPSTMSGWASGLYQPPLETLVDLCRLLGVSADEVLGLEPAKPKVDVAQLIARCNRIEKRVRDEVSREVAALRAQIERLKG
jgi:transcriptional regulator with XRE-family HTH domain